MKSMKNKIFSTIILLSLPALLLAHGSHGNGVMAGFTHPIFGLDHNIAILGAGILGYLSDSKKWYLYVLGFLIPMIIGGALGIGNEATFTIEKIIALSVFVIGALIALQKDIHIGIGIALLGVFGFFHGYAHGAEMSVDNTALKYISGYAMGTALIALIGLLIGRFLKKKKSTNFIVLVGGIILGFGSSFLLDGLL